MNMPSYAPSTLTSSPRAFADGGQPKERWPLEESGPLPSYLLGPEYLEQLFFRVGPVKWKCSAQAVRRAFKSLAKKYSVVTPTLNVGVDLADRDKVLVQAICDNAKTRRKFDTLEIIAEKRDVSGRGGRWTHTPTIDSFAETVWHLGYYGSAEQSLRDLAKWTLKVGGLRPDLGRGRYLEADGLRQALAAGDCPIDVNSADFARIVVLFAARLPVGERRSLLQAAVDGGCECLSPLLSCLASGEAAVEEESLPPRSPEIVDQSPPRLRTSCISDAIEQPSDPPEPELVRALEVAREAKAERLGEASTYFARGIAHVVDLPGDEFERALASAQVARRAKLDLDDRERDVAQLVNALISGAEATLGRRIALPAGATLPEQVEMAGRISSLSALYDPQIGIVASWLRDLPDPISISELEELPKRIAISKAAEKDRREFYNEVVSYFSEAANSLKGAQWLEQLNPDETSVIFEATHSSSPVFGAVLARYGLDSGSITFARSLADIAISIKSETKRRNLFRFIPLSSAILDGDIRLRRIAAAEHLKDILTYGPMAQITDPSTGLTDHSVVGHRVAQFVAIVSANLDYIEQLSDIRELTKSEADVSFASDEAIRFIGTPSGMSGNFRRLREIAREMHLSPIVVAGRLDLVAGRSLVREIESGEVQRRVLAHLTETSGGAAKLETQHETQLSRYLDAARKLIARAVATQVEKVGTRQTALADELRDILAALTGSSIVGSEGWVEHELKRALAAPSREELPQTLLGSVEPFGQRQWSNDDVEWARSFIDLAEFYLDPRPTTLEVGGALLHWACLGRCPSKIEIATELLERGLYHAALEILKAVPGADAKLLRGRIEATVGPRVRQLESQIDMLQDADRRINFDELISYQPLRSALKARDLDLAEEYLELLEIELLELKGRAAKAEADSSALARASELTRLLLRAGVSGYGLDSDIDDLERRWADELDQRRSDRQHLTSVSDIFKDLDGDAPEFRPYIDNIRDFLNNSEDPGYWLPADRAAMFSEFLTGSREKLRNLVSMFHILEPPARMALPVVLDAYVSFVMAQIEGLHAVGSNGVADSVFERILEFDELVRSSVNPPSCVQALIDAGEISALKAAQAHSIASAASQRSAGDASLLFRNAIEAKSWSDLQDLSRVVRATAPDDDIKRIDEVGDFARTMLALENGHVALAYDLLDVSARAISTTGHPVQRALSSREQIETAYLLLKSALQVEDAERFNGSPSPARWEGLLKSSPDLLKSLNESGRLPQASRVLEQILSGAVAFEVCERIWSAASTLSDPTQSRAELLRFLYERGKHEAIVRLAARFDPPIKTRLEQLLDLRAVVVSRADLLPAANAIAEQVAQNARSVPFRNFVHRLPSAGKIAESAIDIDVDNNITLRHRDGDGDRSVHIPFTVTARGMIPEQLQVQLFAEDDVSFAGRRGRTVTLSEEILYSATEFSVDIELGPSWSDRAPDTGGDGVRLRFSAKTITGEMLTKDIVVSFKRDHRDPKASRYIDNETILQFYPGVTNTPAEGINFIGRIAEIEQLQNYLVSTPQPSPVLLTGMRRVGKTSLLYEFHRRHKTPGDNQALTIYVSIAEQRSAFLSKDQTVSSAFFSAIARAIAKPNFPATDHNKVVGERLKQVLGREKNDVRIEVEKCFDEESLSDSLMILAERILEWVGSGEQRVIFLIDEAESLVVPYLQGGTKKVELEQLLQSLREISQTTPNVGIAISGSNHIAEFAREYKNAFFGSCARIDLGGITERTEAEKLIAPYRVDPFVQFEADAVDYAIHVCAGMPQFMWQVGAAATCRVRSGFVARAEIRAAVAALVDGRQNDLPFKPYDVLEPLEHMLKLQGEREQDLLWLLLRRVAVHSSLAAPEASRHIFIEQSLLEIDGKEAWNRRLRFLVELDILSAPQPHSYSFKVPLFGEGFRASKNAHSQAVRLQRVAL